MIDGPRSDPFLKQATDRVAGSDPGVDLDLFRLSFALTRAANRFTRHVESAVHRPRNLSTAGFRILFTIWACGPLAGHRIAVLAGLSRASVSRARSTPGNATATWNAPGSTTTAGWWLCRLQAPARQPSATATGNSMRWNAFSMPGLRRMNAKSWLTFWNPCSMPRWVDRSGRPGRFFPATA